MLGTNFTPSFGTSPMCVPPRYIAISMCGAQGILKISKDEYIYESICITRRLDPKLGGPQILDRRRH